MEKYDFSPVAQHTEFLHGISLSICFSCKEEGILELVHNFIALLTEWKIRETVRLTSAPRNTFAFVSSSCSVELECNLLVLERRAISCRKHRWYRQELLRQERQE